MTIGLGNLFSMATAGLYIDVDLSGAVYPDEADVLDGVQYGPTGTDYEGTFGAAVGLDVLDPASALVHLYGVNAGVAGIVGTRIYPERAPQGARFPYGIVSKASSEHEHHLTAATGQSLARMEVTWFSESPGELHELVEFARRCVDGFYGEITSGSVSLEVGMLHVRSDRTEVVFRNLGDDRGIFVGMQQIDMWHEVEVPTFGD